MSILIAFTLGFAFVLATDLGLAFTPLALATVFFVEVFASAFVAAFALVFAVVFPEGVVLAAALAAGIVSETGMTFVSWVDEVINSAIRASVGGLSEAES